MPQPKDINTQNIKNAANKWFNSTKDSLGWMYGKQPEKKQI